MKLVFQKKIAMKRKIYLFALLGLFLAATACQDDEETMPVVKPAESGMFVDERDGTEYGWVRIGNRDWMTSNMRYEPETGLYGCYAEEGFLGEGSMSDNMFRKYGYYYNYAAAMTVAPQGWRLPTDADWADLERALGMSEPEIGAIGERGTYEGELMQQGEEGTGLKLEAGGFYSVHPVAYNDNWRFRSVFGYFWTATADPAYDGFIFYRKIAYNSTKVFRQSTMTTNWLNVRCCREVQ